MPTKSNTLSDKSAFLNQFDISGPGLPESWQRVLDAVWPEVHEHPKTGCVIPEVDQMWLQDMVDWFGLSLSLDTVSARDLGHAYDVCVLGMGPFVEKALKYPELDLFAYLSDWPLEWVEYVQAVAQRNLLSSFKLAQSLNILSPDCTFPPGVHVLQKDENGLVRPTLIAAKYKS